MQQCEEKGGNGYYLCYPVLCYSNTRSTKEQDCPFSYYIWNRVSKCVSDVALSRNAQGRAQATWNWSSALPSPCPTVSHEAQIKLTLEDMWAHTALQAHTSLQTIFRPPKHWQSEVTLDCHTPVWYAALYTWQLFWLVEYPSWWVSAHALWLFIIPTITPAYYSNIPNYF